MKCRIQAVLWIAFVAAGVLAGPACLDDDARQRQFELGTLEIVWSLAPREQAAVVAIASALQPRAPSASGLATVAAARESPRARWRAYACVLALRLALLACALVAFLPVLAAGVVDGAAMRRVRRRQGEAAQAGPRALVSLAFAPMLWVVTPWGAGLAVLAAWAGATALALSSALQRGQS
jgi:hypothetical protein